MALIFRCRPAGSPARWVRPAIAFGWLLAAGCANFSVEPAADPKAPGLHFFMPKPYLLFWWERTATVKSGVVIESVVPHLEVLYLPDRSERYAITQQAVFARGDFAYGLRDGWRLETINGDLDATEFLRLLADTGTTALERTLPQAAAPPPPDGTPLPAPVMYEPEWDEGNRTYRFHLVPLEGLGLPPGAGPR